MEAAAFNHQRGIQQPSVTRNNIRSRAEAADAIPAGNGAPAGTGIQKKTDVVLGEQQPSGTRTNNRGWGGGEQPMLHLQANGGLAVAAAFSQRQGKQQPLVKGNDKGGRVEAINVVPACSSFSVNHKRQQTQATAACSQKKQERQVGGGGKDAIPACPGGTSKREMSPVWAIAREAVWVCGCVGV